MKVLITGGCGFIGYNFVNYITSKNLESLEVTVLDSLVSYTSKQNSKLLPDNVDFVHSDINEIDKYSHLLPNTDVVFNFAAETHVDNSIFDPNVFIRSNVLGLSTLLQNCHKNGIKDFIHISTDEVYGSSETKFFSESDSLNPSSPYSASKAAAEMLVNSYNHSFNLPIIITRGNNVYGSNQYPEKVIPKFIKQLKNNEKITIQGDGSCIRAFLHSDDTANAFIIILEKGKVGEIYNIGCDENMEYSILDIAKILIKKIKGIDNNFEDYIEYIDDRPFNDKRYYISNNKVKELGWNIKKNLNEELNKLI